MAVHRPGPAKGMHLQPRLEVSLHTLSSTPNTRKTCAWNCSKPVANSTSKNQRLEPEINNDFTTSHLAPACIHVNTMQLAIPLYI
jgi:hypothetical protein